MYMKFEFPPKSNISNSKDSSFESKSVNSNLRNFVNKKSFRALLLAIVLSTSGLKAKGNESFSDFESKTNGDALALKSNIEKNDRLFKLEIANYFDTDSDIIPEDKKSKITEDFKNFLDNLNEDDISDIELNVFSACDERRTSRDGGNEQLAIDRGNSFKNILTEVLSNYKNEKLSVENLNILNNKSIKCEIPSSDNGSEKGVIYLRDLINPVTNANFTDKELEDIKKNNKDEYVKLLSLCRTVTFEVSLVYVDDFKLNNKDVTFNFEDHISARENIIVNKIENLKDYDNVILCKDNSPSVDDSKNYIADIISRQDLKNTKVNVYTFSNKLGEGKSYTDSRDIANEILNIKYNGNVNERIVSSALSAIEELPDVGNNVVFMITDEAFQDVSWEKIKELKSKSVNKKAEVYFCYADDKEGLIHQTSLQELENEFIDRFFDKITPNINLHIKIINNNINSLKSLYDQQQFKILKYNLNESNKTGYEILQKRASDLAERIAELEKTLFDLQSDFDSRDPERLYNNEFIREHNTSGLFDGSKIIALSGRNIGNSSSFSLNNEEQLVDNN